MLLVKFNLALSLHAANDKKRSRIMPINDNNSLEALAEALKYFYEKTGTRPTFEYIIFKDFNDKIEDARELADFCKHVPCKVNVIEYNSIEGGEFQKAEDRNIKEFCNYLEIDEDHFLKHTDGCRFYRLPLKHLARHKYS